MVVDRLRIRRSGTNPATRESPWSWPWNISQRTLSGATVSDESALSLTAFYRGVSLIARTLAGLPLQVFEETIGQDGTEGETRKLKTPDTRFLWLRPNEEMTRQTFWERIFADEVRGNAFIFVEKDEDGGPAALWYIERQRVKVGRTRDRRKVYEVDNELPMIDYKQGGEIVHIPNWGGALVGYDPVKIAAEAIALGLSAQEYAARTFSQGQTPPGVITSEASLTVAQADAIASRWERLHAGIRNMHKIAVLGNGAKFQQTSVNPGDMQLEVLRKFQVTEIARLLGLPPHLLADVERSTSWGTGIEEQNRNLLQFTFAAHINAVEQAVSDDLLVRELTNRYARLNLAALLRASTLQRFQAYALGYGRWLTPNDIRALEEMEPVEGGDQLLAQSQYVPIDEVGAVAVAGGQAQA